MRPAAVCTAPPAVHTALSITSPPPPPLPPPVSTVNETGGEVAALPPPRRTLSRAVTCQLHSPSVSPSTATLHVSPFGDAANDWVCVPPGNVIANVTDRTPLPVSTTTAENTCSAPSVAPSPGSIALISGGAVSLPDPAGLPG